MTMWKNLAVVFAALAMPLALRADQPTVNVEPPNLQGPRQLQDQTATAVVRDYLESWQVMRSALAQNRAALLDADFVGDAKDKLADTVHSQAAMGIHTQYHDLSHDLRIVFYSPEGLSIQLLDNVEYDEEVLDQQKVLATQRVHARYIVVMTPSEVRWRVRVIQALPE